MSWLNGISATNLDNPEIKKQGNNQTVSGTTEPMFDIPTDLSMEDVGLAVAHAENDDSSETQATQTKTVINYLEEMFQNGDSLENIKNYCTQNKLDLNTLLKKNVIIRQIVEDVEKNPQYKSLLNINLGPEAKLVELYSGNESVSEIDKKINEEIKGPLDLRNNKEDLIKAIDYLKDKFEKCKTNDERNKLIAQLEKLTGIKFGNYAKNNAEYVKRVFAVMYSLTMAVLDKKDDEGFIFNGQKVIDPNEIISCINKTLRLDKYQNTADKLGCFASFCQRELLDVNKDSDVDLNASIRQKVDEQVKYASSLSTMIQNLCLENDENEAKISEIIDPSEDYNSYLDINDYISKAEKAIKSVTSLKSGEIKKKIAMDSEFQRLQNVRYLLKIYNDYKTIQAELAEMENNLENLTPEQKEKYDEYKKIEGYYQNWISGKGIQDCDMDKLNEIGLKEFEGEITDAQIQQLKNAGYKSDFVRYYGKKFEIIKNHSDLAFALQNALVDEIKGKNRKDAIKILMEMKSKTKDEEKLKVLNSLIKSYETIDDNTFKAIMNWNSEMANGMDETCAYEKLDAIIENIKANNPDLEPEDIASMILDVIMNSFRDDPEFIDRVSCYIFKKIDSGDFNANLFESKYLTYEAQINEYSNEDIAVKYQDMFKEDQNLRQSSLIKKYAAANAKNMSKYGDEKINADIENAIQSHPDLYDANSLDVIMQNWDNTGYTPSNETVQICNSIIENGMASVGESSATGVSAGTSTVSASDNSSVGGYSFGMHEQSNYNNNNGYSMNWPDSDKTIDKPKNNKSNKSENETVKTSVVINQIFDLPIIKLLTNKKLEEMKDAVSSGKYKNGEPVSMPEKIEMVQTIWNESPSQVNTLTWAANSVNSDVINIIIHNIPQWNKYLYQTPKSVQNVYRRIQEENTPYYEHKLMKNEEKTVDMV